jgi:hypothetical protein
MRLITVTLLIGYLVLLLLVSQYEEEPSYLLYFQEQLQYEYQLQAFLPLKLLLVILISFGWIYATRWNQYDPALWMRSSVLSTALSRFVVLLEWSGLVSFVGTMLYLAVYRLYPYQVTVEEAMTLILSVQLFQFYYNSLCFWLDRVIQHLFGFVIPLLLYLIVLLQTEVLLASDSPFLAVNIIQVIIPDIAILESGYGFLFGAVMIVSVAFIWLVFGIWFVQKQDAI